MLETDAARTVFYLGIMLETTDAARTVLYLRKNASIRVADG